MEGSRYKVLKDFRSPLNHRFLVGIPSIHDRNRQDYHRAHNHQQHLGEESNHI